MAGWTAYERKIKPVVLKKGDFTLSVRSYLVCEAYLKNPLMNNRYFFITEKPKSYRHNSALRSIHVLRHTMKCCYMWLLP